VFHLAEASGPSVSLREELRWLAGGGPLHVLVPGPGAVAEEYGEFAAVATAPYGALAMPRGPVGAARAARQLARDVRTFRSRLRAVRPARVVAVTTMLPALLLAARAENVPVLVYAAELVPTAPGAGRRLGGWFVLRTTRAVAGAIASCSDTVARQFGPGAPATVTVYPPVRPPERADGAAFRRTHGIAPDARCVAVIGSISRGRGQDVLIRALPRLRQSFPGLRALLVGEPHPRPADVAYRDELHALASALDVADAIAWVGYADPVGDVYAAADVVVNPARREAFGRVAAEALLAGTPVVATRVEAVPEVLRDGADALLVEPNSSDELAGAIARLLEDGELARRLVASGAERVAREFTPERSLAGFAAAVRALG
jgi:glycosyltransferase involved in cell wall biosynthesis